MNVQQGKKVGFSAQEDDDEWAAQEVKGEKDKLWNTKDKGGKTEQENVAR